MLNVYFFDWSIEDNSEFSKIQHRVFDNLTCRECDPFLRLQSLSEEDKVTRIEEAEESGAQSLLYTQWNERFSNSATPLSDITVANDVLQV